MSFGKKFVIYFLNEELLNDKKKSKCFFALGIIVIISYTPPETLTKNIVEIIHSNIHKTGEKIVHAKNLFDFFKSVAKQPI